jgi:nucleoside 2-deoxyribosyltransferase
MPTPKINRCPICDLPADILVGNEPNTARDIYGGQCPRCGEIHVTDFVVTEYKRKNRRYLLSAFFRRYPGKPPLVNSQNVEELISAMPVPLTVSEKLNGVLRFLGDPEHTPGTQLPFDIKTDYPLIFAADSEEANFLIGTLIGRRFVWQQPGTTKYQVTADGYERIEQIEAASYKSSSKAFVAMWFDSSRDAIYKAAIEPAIRDAGYHPVRIDLVEHVKKIDDEIVANIRESRFLVADFTGQRAGVYYEAGFMHGLGRNVFWLVEKKQLDQTHFDVRQYNFIDYESPADARKRLYDRIMAVEGKGPEVDALRPLA